MLSATNLSENTREIMSALSLGDDERTLSSLPIYYCYGTSVLHAHLRAGATVFLDAYRFPEEAVKRIARERITFVPGVPSLFEALARRSTLGQGAVPDKIMISGGRTTPATLAELRKRLPATRFYMRYGVTELTSAASILPPELLDAKLGSIGRGLPSYPLSVLRADGSATHVDVVEVAVCAEPDALRGEMPIALVVLRAGVEDPSPVLAHAGRLLPRFKVPGRFVVVAALPRTASGKLRREALPALIAPQR